MPTGSGGGLASVQTNTTLSGSGTAASPLSVANWPLTYFSCGATGSNESLTGVNQIDAAGFVLPYPVTFAHIATSVQTADAVNHYDMGIYTKAGALVANIGGQTLPSTGIQSFATLQGAQTLLPGLYAFAWSGAATTAQLLVSNAVNPPWFQNHNIGTAVAGTLPASVSAIAIAVANFQFFFALL